MSSAKKQPRSIAAQIQDKLAKVGPKSADEIAALFPAAKKTSLSSALRRSVKVGQLVKDGEYYRLPGAKAQAAASKKRKKHRAKSGEQKAVKTKGKGKAKKADADETTHERRVRLAKAKGVDVTQVVHITEGREKRAQSRGYTKGKTIEHHLAVLRWADINFDLSTEVIYTD